MNANKRILKVLSVAVGIVLLTQAVPAGADEVTLGASQELDVYHKELFSGSVIYGTSTALQVGSQVTDTYYNWYRALLAFDVSQLRDGNNDPIYSSIESLTLKTSTLVVKAGPNNTTTVYAMTQTWDPDAEVLWNDSSNHVPTALDSHDYPVSDTGEVTFDLTGVDLTALVDSWLDGTNEGLVLVGYEPVNPTPGTANYNTKYSDGSELIVEYTAVPEPATMAMLGLGGVAMLIRRRRKVA